MQAEELDNRHAQESPDHPIYSMGLDELFGDDDDYSAEDEETNTKQSSCKDYQRLSLALHEDVLVRVLFAKHVYSRVQNGVTVV